MIDICYVGTGVNYHFLSYWSFVMMSPVEFSAGEFCANQIWQVLEMATRKNNNGLLESLSRT